MTHTIEKVRKFHVKFGHPVALQVTPGTKELRSLRVKLIAEELVELCQALGVNLVAEYKVGIVSSVYVQPVFKDEEVDCVEAADALGDLDYVVQGANLVFGFPSEAILDEIQESNMSKLGEDGNPIYREDGKIMKGPNYFKPNIAKVLATSAGVVKDN